MCTDFERVITRYHSKLAKNLIVGPDLLSLLRSEDLLTLHESQYIESLSKFSGNYKAASTLLDRLKLYSSADFKKIFDIFTETRTGEHLVNFIQAKLGICILHSVHK